MTRVVSPADLFRESMGSIAIVFASAASMNYHPASDTLRPEKCERWTGEFRKFGGSPLLPEIPGLVDVSVH